MKEPFDGAEKRQILAELWAEARKPAPTEMERKLEKWQAYTAMLAIILAAIIARSLGWI